MKKLLVGLAAAATAVAIATPTVNANLTDALIQAALDDVVTWDPEFAEIAPTANPAGAHQFVAGSVKVIAPSGFQHVRVSAHSGPGGIDPHGSVRVTFDSPLLPTGSADVKGDVVCLSESVFTIRMNVAALLQEPHQGFTHVLLSIDDLGNPGTTMGQSPDRGFIGFANAPAMPRCAPGGLLTLLGESHGNFVMRRETP